MTDKLIEQSCATFTELLSSKAPVPGGGGAAALIGALASALGAMAVRLTIGKKKFLSFEADHRHIIEKCDFIRERLLELIETDAEAFEPLSRAYSMDKTDPNYIETMRTATLEAASAPLEMMRFCAEIITVLEELPEKCSKLLLSDIGCAAVSAKAALECAAMNIFVNTRLLPEDAEAQRMEWEAETLKKEFTPRADGVSMRVMEYLRRPA